MKTLTILLLTLLATTASTNQFLQNLQAGLLEEEVNRNLDAAITIYSNLVTQADTDRAIFANALFRLAETYRKKGQTNEAIAAYQKLVQQYPEQSALIRFAQTNLTNSGVRDIFQTVSQDVENIEIARLKKMFKESPDLVLNGNQLYQAVEKNHYQVAEFLLDQGVPINGNSQNSLAPLHVAAFMGHKEMAEFLIKRGADVNQENRSGSFRDSYSLPGLAAYKVSGTPLHLSAGRGHLLVSETLLKAGANPNDTSGSGTPLHKAAEHGHTQLCKLLLDSGADPEIKAGSAETPLGSAIRNRAETAVKLFLQHGAKLGNTTAGGMNPLVFAAIQQDLGLLQTILSFKPGIDLIIEPLPPLNFAFGLNHIEGLKLLLEAGANPNLQGKDGSAALHFQTASLLNLTETVELLLQFKADPNLQNEFGYTPLHYAVTQRNRETIQLLLDAGANPLVKNRDNRSPLDWAELRMKAKSYSIKDGKLSFSAESSADYPSAILNELLQAAEKFKNEADK